MKAIKIVTYDWLEDSLQTRSHKREGEYLLSKVEKVEKKLKAERKSKEKKELKRDGKCLLFPCTPPPSSNPPIFLDP